MCSDCLTSAMPGDEIMFELESVRSFHLPSDPSCPIMFICTVTGFAPMRGLLQNRSYLQSRGENLGPAYIFFGSRGSKERLFYQDIKEFQESGPLKNFVFSCYSRDPGKKKEYITDKLRTKEVKDVIEPILVEKNTHIFIAAIYAFATDKIL